MEITYHYPPELFSLLVDTVPLLCRSKKDVLLFCRGAGISSGHFADLESRVRLDKNTVNKYEIVRTILWRLNERGADTLGERRELLRRVVEFEDFSTCWPDDQLKAKGLVSEIRRVVNVKDSFTRMNLERKREAQERRKDLDEKLRKTAECRHKRDEIRRDLFALFGEADVARRGAQLESVVNRLFATDGILVREAFRLHADKDNEVREQIDGVIEIDGHLYLVEMKWLSRPVDVNDVSRHLVRIYHRGSARGLFVSFTPFTDPALHICVEALQRTVVALCLVEEIVSLLENDGDLKELLRAKIHAAAIEKRPFHRVAQAPFHQAV